MEDHIRNILFVTGTRADFGKLKPLIEEVERTELFSAHIFATGMHMLARYGSTVREIQKSGFKNIFTYINQDGVSTGMDSVLANTVSGLSFYVREFRPDLIVVHGDRVEALAGAIVGALQNVLVAHVEGGEVSGTVDELIRHAVSKMAHLHFVSNEFAKKRLIQMGELPDSIFVIGSPEVDIMLSDNLPDIYDVKARYEIPFQNYGVFTYHPVTTELDELEKNMKSVLDALRVSGHNFVVIYPNSDHGSEIIMRSIEGLRGEKQFRLIPSMRFEYYLSLLKNAKIVVGNSSSFVREAPVYGVPTINIGTRQLNRSDHASIMNISEDRDLLLSALNNIPPKGQISLAFGAGTSARQFVNILKGPSFWSRSCQKQFQDIGFNPVFAN